MTRYVLGRIGFMLVTLFIIATLTFFLMQTLPGSPFNNEDKLTDTQKERLYAKYGLDDPIPVQYVKYLGAMLKGDFGESYQSDGRPVMRMIRERIGPSAFIGGQAMLVGTLLGLLLGILASLRHNTYADYGVMVFAVIGTSIPSFVFAAVLQLYFGVYLEILPVALWNSEAQVFEWAYLKYTVLPSVALAVGVIAGTARFMRTEMLEVLGQDYIITAHAKGLSKATVVVKHSIRNALIPVITIAGPTALAIMTGSLVIERIFAVPGLGRLFVDSIVTNDYTVIMGLTMFYSALFILVILIVDLLYGVIDPRIRIAGGKN
jgi:oligopeptide transport system permease protein